MRFKLKLAVSVRQTAANLGSVLIAILCLFSFLSIGCNSARNTKSQEKVALVHIFSYFEHSSELVLRVILKQINNIGCMVHGSLVERGSVGTPDNYRGESMAFPNKEPGNSEDFPFSISSFPIQYLLAAQSLCLEKWWYRIVAWLYLFLWRLGKLAGGN